MYGTVNNITVIYGTVNHGTVNIIMFENYYF